jgi:hypothetical protein
MNKIITVFIVAAVVIIIYYFEPIFNKHCMEPQVIDGHFKNCELLGVEKSCSWLEHNNIPEGYTFDLAKAAEACVTSENLSNFLVEVVSKNKVGN